MAAPQVARAESEIQLRSVYYKERATRVVQPVIDVQLGLGPTLQLDSHLLVDSITSASAAAGAEFTETRVEGGAALTLRRDDHQLGVFGRYSNEPDYKSRFAGVRGSVELMQKNTLVGAALALGSDEVNNAGAAGGMTPLVEGTMTTIMTSVTVAQLLSTRAVASLTYDQIVLRGFLANPYRPVHGGGMQISLERVPASRIRHAIFGSLRQFVPATRSTLIAGYRLYTDSWDLDAHTPELRLIQELTGALRVHLRFRYHWQSGAYFYKPIYDTLDPELEPYVTEDAKLSAFTSQAYGLRLDTALSWLGLSGPLARARFDVSFEYVVQNNYFGNAVVGQIGLSIPIAN